MDLSSKTLLDATDADCNTPLHLACEGGQVGVVELLISNGANVTAQNIRGELPVHIAAEHESVEIIKQVMDKEDCTLVEYKDKHGYTPLHHAAEKNQTSIITYLHDQW